MSTSDVNNLREEFFTLAFRYLAASIFCALFGAIYEAFSFGVYSYFMIYAFGWPLIFGTLPFLARGAKKQSGSVAGQGRLLRRWGLRLYHAGVATLTVGSIFRGILDIYGTTSNITKYYWIVGGGLVGVGACVNVMRGRRLKTNG